MQLNIRLSGWAILILAALGAAAWFLHASYAKLTASKTETTLLAPEVPVVMRTPGGLLEVATVTALERFTRADTKEFWGIPLGTTVSHIQTPVVYRYHIELAKEWRIALRGKTAIVHAPRLNPSLPVAFDTSALQKYTQSGWARFNKDENLAALERSMTPELGARAGSERYLQLATEAGRQTVREFVMQWLLKERHWRRDPEYAVQVYFPGESPP
jgi:hypothetical protein